MTSDELLQRLAALGDVAPAMAELPELLGIGADELSGPISEAIGGGLASVWEKDPPALVLTSLAAEQLGIALDAAGERWVAADDPGRDEAGRGSTTIQEAEGEAPFWSAIADPKAHAPGEGPATFPWETWDRVPMPKVLLGLRVAWPVKPGPRGACGICKGLPLEPGTYCLGCDRMAREPAGPRPAPLPLARIPAITGGGTGPRQEVPDEAALPRLPLRASFWQRQAHYAALAERRKGRSR